MKRSPLLLGVVALGAAMPCFAQAPAAATPGTVALTVRLPDPAQHVLYVDESMPVKPGPLTLYYPKYIPGDHSPDGPIGTMLGLEISAHGKRIAWRRDPVDMFTFHLVVPPATDRIDIRFQFPSTDRSTPHLLDLTWDHVALYRAGYPSSAQMFRPTLVVPADWHYASALKTVSREGQRISFQPVPFNTLVDSPVIAGKYFRQVDLTPAGSNVHRYLAMIGDSAKAIAITPAQTADYRHLIEQAQALFQSHHYAAYHLQLTLSDYTSRGGLEHHQSSDDRARSGSRMFADPDHFMLDASLLPHEYTHSWNGKFMRPAQLWQPNFESPEHTHLIWVYEGLTVYLGDMLTARSGLWSPRTWREVVAYRAAVMSHRPGRDWRPLVDTTTAAQLEYDAPGAWANWRRSIDFYREGQLLWLAVDAKIRTLSHGRHSLDDFARTFFGIDSGSYVTHRYTFDDVVASLNAVQPYDWATFLHTWLDGVDGEVPLLSGITGSGWKLVYTDTPSRYQLALQNVGNGELSGTGINAMFSIGIFLNHAGRIVDVLWQGPAFKAGMAPGMQLLAVDGVKYSAPALRQAIATAHTDQQPVRIEARGEGVTRTYALDYHGGVKYPHLVRIPGTTDYLDKILAPKPVHRDQ